MSHVFHSLFHTVQEKYFWEISSRLGHRNLFKILFSSSVWEDFVIVARHKQQICTKLGQKPAEFN